MMRVMSYSKILNYMYLVNSVLCHFPFSKELKYMHNFKQFHTGLIPLTLVQRENGWHYRPGKVGIQIGILGPIMPAGINTVPSITSEDTMAVGTMLDAKIHCKSYVKHQVYYFQYPVKTVLLMFWSCFF